MEENNHIIMEKRIPKMILLNGYIEKCGYMVTQQHRQMIKYIIDNEQ